MLEYLIDDKFVSKNDKIAVGVSGGADSMLLLWALLDKQKQVGFDIFVINVNHHIRGLASDEDSAFVEKFCKTKKIPHKIIDVDAKALKNTQKTTLEEAARKARYDAFFKVMKEEKLNKLFLAHHKNDQVETILMHIFRGSGILGACGMQEQNNIFRPLLNFEKSEILNLAKEHGVKFVTDETNADNAYARNYVRNVVIPEIEKMYPSAVNAIYQFGEKCKLTQKFIENHVKMQNIEVCKDFIVLKDTVFAEDFLVVREYIKKVFEMLGIFADIEAKHYSLISGLFEAEVNTCIDLPHATVAGKTYNGIKFFKKSKQKPLQEFEFVVGELVLEGVGKIKSRFVSADEVFYEKDVLFVDYGKVSTEAVWRTRKLGDMFAKFGTGSKKLNDYFTDKKIENLFRDKIPVLASGNQILVVAGEDISENVKLDAETEQIVEIRFVSE